MTARRQVEETLRLSDRKHITWKMVNVTQKPNDWQKKTGNNSRIKQTNPSYVAVEREQSPEWSIGPGPARETGDRRC